MAEVFSACTQWPLLPYQAPSSKLDPDEPQPFSFEPNFSTDSFDLDAVLLEFDIDAAAIYDVPSLDENFGDDGNLFFSQCAFSNVGGIAASASSCSLESNCSSASTAMELDSFPFQVPTGTRSRRINNGSRHSPIEEAARQLPLGPSPLSCTGGGNCPYSTEADQQLPVVPSLRPQASSTTAGPCSRPVEFKSAPVAVVKPCWPVLDVPTLGMTRQQRVQRYREKRKRRTFEKTIRYEARRAYAEVRPRIKGRFATKVEAAAIKAAELAGVPYEC